MPWMRRKDGFNLDRCGFPGLAVTACSWTPPREQMSWCFRPHDTIGAELYMRANAGIAIAVIVLSGLLLAQEEKPVPKDSVRVSLSGCTKGYIFTVGPRTLENPGTVNIAEGTHLRMNVPKKVMSEIKAHEGSMIAISGLMKKGQFQPDGVT